jgi:hypothetical protein
VLEQAQAQLEVRQPQAQEVVEAQVQVSPQEVSRKSQFHQQSHY